MEGLEAALRLEAVTRIESWSRGQDGAPSPSLGHLETLPNVCYVFLSVCDNNMCLSRSCEN